MEPAESTTTLSRAGAYLGRKWREHDQYSPGAHAWAIVAGVLMAGVAVFGAAREGAILARVLLSIVAVPLGFTFGYITFFFRFGGHGAPKEHPSWQRYLVMILLGAVFVALVVADVASLR